MFSKIWTWLKVYWYVPLIVIPMIIGLIILGRTKEVSGIFEGLRANYQEQLATLERLSAEERERKEKLDKQYQDAVRLLEEKYKVESRELSDIEKIRIRKLVEQYQNDLDGLAEKLKETYDL